ncbi:hypothetical protein MLD38_029669 [Melastoma candidum]|uniref:Uncharacterized protein n=1 Tax=Melastoma candidum TaxID=119954 RepID=A0ACB9N673_9MYRT|nr:hypothetical protein MLD38_029669 [Melastoma candidum]
MEIDDSPWGNDFEESGGEKLKDSGRYRSRDGKKGSRREEDYRSKEKEREVVDDRFSSRDRRKGEREERDKDRRREDREEYEKERGKYAKSRDNERDHDQHDRHRDKERDRDRENDRKQRGKEKSGREKEREKERDRLKDKEREKSRDKERDRKAEEKIENSRRDRDVDNDVGREDLREREGVGMSWDALDNDRLLDVLQMLLTCPPLRLEERILKAKEERLKKKPEVEGVSEVLAWVGRSRKLEEKKISEKEKALQRSKLFEEQDNMVQGDMEDETEAPSHSHDLAGVKVLDGLDKVIEGGAVVLTLKTKTFLLMVTLTKVNVDMLENVEIGEQKRRDDAYKSAKKKTGIYDDKFNDDPGSEKKMLPQYDEPVRDEGITLGAGGRLTGEAERKLEELRKRLQGSSTADRFEDLTSSTKVSSDYYTQEEMLQFKKPKKKKSLRKREKLDLDALEAEAKTSGLGAGDLGSRNDGRRQAIKQDQDRIDAEKRRSAYESAHAKAEEASRLLRTGQIHHVKTEDDETPVIADDEEDLRKSLERARKLALKKKDEDGVSGPKAIALLAATTQSTNNESPAVGDAQENTVVITEMEEFVWGLQLNEESRKPDTEDVFMEEDEAPLAPENEMKDEPSGWTEVKEEEDAEIPSKEEKEEVVPDETIHEAAVGKGLSGALRLLKERGALKETVEWGGRNMDKKKSKLVGIAGDGAREINIERTDEFGRVLTPKEAFRIISHKFHGKEPGKMKQEKRMRQYQEELKLKQMKNSDTPSLSAERMREAQAQLKTPYLVLSGHVKTGQDSDPRSSFGTVEKDPGSLTPMLGDRKAKHFLGIKRKPETSNLGPGKKSKS